MVESGVSSHSLTVTHLGLIWLDTICRADRAGGDSRRRDLVARGGSWFSSLFGYLKQAIHREGDAVLNALAHVPIIPVWGHGAVSKDHQYTGGEALRVTLACGGGRVMLRPGLEGGDDEWSLHTLVDSGAGKSVFLPCLTHQKLSRVWSVYSPGRESCNLS